MKNNTGYLIKQRFSTIGFHVGRIITFVIFTAIFLAANVTSVLWIDKISDSKDISNVLILCDSLVEALLMVMLTAMIFRGEVKNNQVSLELRQGYKPKQTFLARIVGITTIFAAFMLLAIIFNLATIGIKGKLDSVIWYRLFISSLGWYAIVGIVSVGMTIFFCSFMNAAGAGSLNSFIMILLILFGSLFGGMAAINGKPYVGANEFAGELTTKKVDKAVLDFAINDLDITSKEEWDEIAQDFLRVKDSGSNNNIDNRFESDNYKSVDMSIYNEKFSDWTNTDDGKSLAQTYYNMLTGDWDSYEYERDGGSSGTYISRQYYSEDKYNKETNAAAGFAGFGSQILKNNNKLADFLDKSHKFFENNHGVTSFADLTNWDNLNGSSKADVHEYGEGSNKSISKYVDINPVLTANENYYGVMKEFSKFSENNSLKELAPIADASVLSNVRPLGMSFFPATNAPINRPLYPVFAVGGNANNESDLQEEIVKLADKLDVSSDEFLFNRNLFYFLNEAFEDFDAYKTQINGITNIENSWYFDSENNVLAFIVENPQIIRRGYAIDSKTPLEYGEINKDIFKDSKINATVEYEKYNEDTSWKPDKEAIQIKDMSVYDSITSAEYVKSHNFDGNLGTIDYTNGSTLSYANNIYNKKNWLLIKLNDSNELAKAIKEAYSNGHFVYNGWYFGDEPGSFKFEFNSNLFNVVESVDTDANTAIISKFEVKGDSAKLSYWGEENKFSSSSVKFSDSKGELKITNEGEISDQIKFDRNVEGKLVVSRTDKFDKDVSINLVDDSYFKPDYDYDKSLAHKNSLNMIFNPLVQLQGMFNGINYRHVISDSLYEANNSNNVGFGTNGMNVKSSIDKDGNFVIERANYIEVVYLYYTAIEALLTFAAYWIYKKKIVA